MVKKINKEHSPPSALPIAPSMQLVLDSIHFPLEKNRFTYRAIFISCLAIVLGLAGGIIAQILTRLIGLITNIFFYGKLSTEFSSPAYNNLGLFVIVIPIIGALIVGIMAKYGSAGIRGHGIPEAMEQVLLNESKIPPRLTFLKPLSAAISIGTGGPFGAEGPIIATGGALGSFLGQIIKTTSDERKTLLAAGAAAGMAATFGSPVSAILLAVELLLFEFRPQSLLPVSLASATATAVRMFFVGTAPIFLINDLIEPSSLALITYLIFGAIIGVCSVFVTKSVYAVEDFFEKLPIHWMWWPALGALAVGIIGYFSPHTLGVGYDNIENILTGTITGKALIFLFTLKFVSWAISLGSGTSGGTLAPLFTIGGGIGALLGSITIFLFPDIGVDVRIAALVGMAAIFAGSARALLTSIIFAFETTIQPIGLLPLLLGCSSAYLISSLMMRNTIMTEKIERRGIKVPNEYEADFLDKYYVKDCATLNVSILNGKDSLEKVRAWLNSHEEGSLHHGYPVINNDNQLIGVVTRRELFNPALENTKKIKEVITKPLVVIFENNTIRDAADLMALHNVTRLPVVKKENPLIIIGLISRNDLLSIWKKHLEKEETYQKHLKFKSFKK